MSWEKAPLSPESCPAVCLSCVLDLAEQGQVNCPVSTLPDAVGKIQSHQYMGNCQPTSRLVWEICILNPSPTPLPKARRVVLIPVEM